MNKKGKYITICGGVIPVSTWRKAVKKNGGLGYMMCFILPDEQFKEYKTSIECGDEKKAHKIFKKYAWSII